MKSNLLDKLLQPMNMKWSPISNIDCLFWSLRNFVLYYNVDGFCACSDWLNRCVYYDYYRHMELRMVAQDLELVKRLSLKFSVLEKHNNGCQHKVYFMFFPSWALNSSCRNTVCSIFEASNIARTVRVLWHFALTFAITFAASIKKT